MRYEKRILDLIIVSVLIIPVAILVFICSLLILILEGRPIFYISNRLVYSSKEVKIFKLRTMVRDALSSKFNLKNKFFKDGYLDIPLENEVYTKIGRILERTQIVETLQLYNVLIAQMSLVGNRPLPKDNISELSKFINYDQRFLSPAGITGISQIAGKFNLTPEKRLELEIGYSCIYNNKKSNIILCDLTILFYTCVVLITNKHIGYNRAIALLDRFNYKQTNKF